MIRKSINSTKPQTIGNAARTEEHSDRAWLEREPLGTEEPSQCVFTIEASQNKNTLLETLRIGLELQAFCNSLMSTLSKPGQHKFSVFCLELLFDPTLFLPDLTYKEGHSRFLKQRQGT